MAVIKLDGGYNALPISYKRGNPIPLDTTAVWYDEAQLKNYAETGATAYVGQVLTLVQPVLDAEGQDTGVKTAIVYVIANTAGDLIKLGDAGTDADELKERIAELEEVWGADPDSLKETLDSIKEIQDFITSGDGQDSFLNLAEQVNQIYKETYELDENGNPKLVDGKPVLLSKTGLLIDLQEEVREIYNPSNEEGKESGVLVEKTKSINDTIAKLFTPTEVRTENGETVVDENGNRDILKAIGEIPNYINNEIPVATLDRLGRVKSSEAENYVNVKEDGTMEVNSLNVMKLTQTTGDLLILDGGNASGIATE